MNTLNNYNIYAAANTDEEIVFRSSSGGMFTTIASEWLQKENHTCYGASFNDSWECQHIRITDASEIPLIRGSKYAESSLNGIIDLIKKDIESGQNILFSGTPCQCATVRQIFGNSNRLLIVEVVCHGVPQKMLWNKYLDEICENLNETRDDIQSINFRDKSTGWKKYNFTIKFKDGKSLSEFHGENAYMKAFLHNLSLKEGCHKCPFKYPLGSKADITLGDFWRLSKIAPDLDNDRGVSLLISNTEKGMNCLNAIHTLREFAFDEAIELNKSLTTCAARPRNKEAFLTKAKVNFHNAIDSEIKIPISLKSKIFIKKIFHYINHR